MFRLLLRRLSTAAEAAASSSALPSPSPQLRQPLSASLYSRIAEVRSPHVPLAPVLEQWACEGHAVEKHALHGIIKKLIGRRRFAHALELSYWMTDQRHFQMSPGDVAHRVELIAKVHGIESAVKFFSSLPEELRKHHCYSALLKCYGEAKAVGESEELLAKMHGMGMKGVYAYNVMMKLYLETGQIEKVHAMFQDMKENGVKPDTSSMDNLLAAYIAAEDVQGIAKLLEKANSFEKLFSWHAHATAATIFMKSGMLERGLEALVDAEKRITSQRIGRVAYGFLLSTYADLGMYPQVERIWAVYKSKVPPCNSMYMSRINVLLKMNDTDGAAKALKEWETKCTLFYNFSLPNLLVDAYCREGLVEKAVALVDDAINKGRKPYPSTWYMVADGYFKTGQVLKAVDATKKALAIARHVLESDLQYVIMSLNHFMDQKDVEAAEEMASMLQKLVPLTRDVYHCLLKTYIRSGKPVSDLLDRMEEDGLEADEETDRIITGDCQ